MQDTVTYKYQFTILPLQLISKSQTQSQQISASNISHQANTSLLLNKLIVIKLGQTVLKTSHLNTSLNFVQEVQYSKVKKKYNQIKGIIKIYDILQDKSQVISCVGAFQAEDILENKIKKQILSKSIGGYILKMEISGKQLKEDGDGGNRLKVQECLSIPLSPSSNVEDDTFSSASSQNLFLNSSGVINQERKQAANLNVPQQDSIYKLRRVNTLNTNPFHNQEFDYYQNSPGYKKSDIIDLKSAINFGVSKPKPTIHPPYSQKGQNSQQAKSVISNNFNSSIVSNQNKNNPYNSSNKLLSKMISLKKNNAGRLEQPLSAHIINKQKITNNNDKDIISYKSNIVSKTSQNKPVLKHKQSLEDYYKENMADDDYEDNNISNDMNDMMMDIESKNSKQNIENDEEMKMDILKLPKLSLPPLVNHQISTHDFECADSISNSNSNIPTPKIQTPKIKINNESDMKKDIEMMLKMDDEESEDEGKPIMISSDKFPNSNNGEKKDELKILSLPKYQISNSISSNKFSNSMDIEVGELIKSVYNLSNFMKIPKVEANLSSSCYASPSPPPTNHNIAPPQNNHELSMSNASINTSMLSHPEYQLECQKLELETLGEQLIEERRKNLEYEEKLAKAHLKIIASKQKYLQLKHHWDQWCNIGRKFVGKMIKDTNGNYIVEIFKKKKSINIKYEVEKESQDIIMRFLTLTVQNCTNFEKSTEDHLLKAEMSQHKTRLLSQNSEINSPSEFNKIIQKIEATYATNTKLLKSKQEFQTQIHALTEFLQKAQISLEHSQLQKSKLKQNFQELTKQIEQLNFQIASLTGINSYLKQKDQQMQGIITLKENTIESIKKVLQQNNTEMDELEDQLNQCRKDANNKQLMIEELKEELADKEQIVDLYKEMYGQINRYRKTICKQSDIDEEIQTCIKNIVDHNRSSHENLHRIDEEESVNQNENEIEKNTMRSVSKVSSYSNNSDHKSSERNRNIKTGFSMNKAPSIEDSDILNNSTGGGKDSVGKSSHLKQGRQLREGKQLKDFNFSGRNEAFQKSLLLSIIRNNEKIYKIKLHELYGVKKQLSFVANKIQQYIKKLDSQKTLFESVN